MKPKPVADARCLVFDYEGKPLAADVMKRFHLCDLEMRPFTLERKIATGEIQFTPPSNRPFRIALPLKVPTFGEVFVYADNRGPVASSKQSAATPL